VALSYRARSALPRRSEHYRYDPSSPSRRDRRYHDRRWSNFWIAGANPLDVGRSLGIHSGARRANVLSLSCGEAPDAERQSGAPLAATNVKTAGSACKRRDGVRLERTEGRQPRANERPAVGCCEKLGSAPNEDR